jgi:DNA modification methylase
MADANKLIKNVNIISEIKNLKKIQDITCNIYNVDCSKLISKMIKNKIIVDAIITDPPYNISRNHQLGYSNMGRSGMDYGNWDYGFDQMKWLKNISKIVKPGGTVIIFNNWKNMGDIAKELEKHGFIVKDIIRWIKNNPMPRNIHRRYVNDCELAIWVVKEGSPWTFNKPKLTPYLRPEFKTGVGIGNRIHPTQKNLTLIEKIIEIHTKEGDTIFDPFLGSGTTAVAALNYKRKIIGSEIDEKYYKKAIERIKQ